MMDKTSLTCAMAIEENNVVSGMDLRFSRRLNGHPSGPFDQDVSNTCSVSKTPTYSSARNEPPATRIHLVKYYTLSVASVCKISRPRAASAAPSRLLCSPRTNVWTHEILLPPATPANPGDPCSVGDDSARAPPAATLVFSRCRFRLILAEPNSVGTGIEQHIDRVESRRHPGSQG